MLKVTSLSVAYGGLTALDAVSVDVQQGSLVAVVGPNGAGKTTLMKAVSGTITPSSGTIEFKGQDLLAVRAPRRPHLGIAHVPEGRFVFPTLTVMENLEMGATTRAGRDRWNENLALIYDLFPVLEDRRKQTAGTLSGGEQQMVAIARALASSPELLMLDEPSMGLGPAIADAIFECIYRLRRESNLTILLVEQRVIEALEACDHGYILDAGSIVLSGGREVVVGDRRVKQAYLGM